MTEKEKKELEQKIISELKTIYDPEIPVNIYDIGLIYKITIDDKGNVHILMTLTAPNCPVADTLVEEVKEKVKSVKGVNKSEVELTFDPPWSQDMLSDDAKLDMGLI